MQKDEGKRREEEGRENAYAIEMYGVRSGKKYKLCKYTHQFLE